MKPKKHLGQHFLSDPNILGQIVDALAPAPGETVIEIGPGEGGLTRLLADRGAQVIAIEKDRRLAGELAEHEKREAGNVNRETGNVRIVEGDALTADWHQLVRTPFPVSRVPFPEFSVIGNIPYYITSPLLEKALTPPLPSRIVFLVQREVADRITAAPGSKTYGALSVGIQAQCRAERLLTVKAGAFRPPPKVDSAVVRLTPLAAPVVAPEEGRAFRRFVTACFSRRRKQLRNVLAGVVGRAPAAVAAALAGMGFDPTVRPERLSAGDFARLLLWSRQL